MKSTASRAATETKRTSERLRRPGPVRSASQAGEADWRMPSGLGLAEFALRGGFVAPGLMKRPGPNAGERP